MTDTTVTRAALAHSAADGTTHLADADAVATAMQECLWLD